MKIIFTFQLAFKKLSLGNTQACSEIHCNFKNLKVKEYRNGKQPWLIVLNTDLSFRKTKFISI